MKDINREKVILSVVGVVIALLFVWFVNNFFVANNGQKGQILNVEPEVSVNFERKCYLSDDEIFFLDINFFDNGDVVGRYYDADLDGRFEGFVDSSGGIYTTLEYQKDGVFLLEEIFFESRNGDMYVGSGKKISSKGGPDIYSDVNEIEYSDKLSEISCLDSDFIRAVDR